MSNNRHFKTQVLFAKTNNLSSDAIFITLKSSSNIPLHVLQSLEETIQQKYYSFHARDQPKTSNIVIKPNQL